MIFNPAAVQALAASKGIDTFTLLKGSRTSKTSLAEAVAQPTKSTNLRTMALMDSFVRVAYVNADNTTWRIAVGLSIVSPGVNDPASAAGPDFFAASASDKLGTFAPIRLPLDCRTDFYVGIIPRGIATESKLHILDDIEVCDLLRPGIPDTQNTLAQLGAPAGDTDNNALVAAVVPTLVGIPQGAYVPVGHPAADPLPTLPPGTSYSSTFIGAAEAVRHALRFNSGHPANSADCPLFRAGQVNPTTSFPPATYSDLNWVGTFKVSPLPLDVRFQDEAEAHWTEIRDENLLHWQANSPLISTPPTASTPVSPEPSLAKALGGINTILKEQETRIQAESSGGLTAKEAGHVKGNQLLYRIGLATVVLDDVAADGTSTLRLATISKTFRTISNLPAKDQPGLFHTAWNHHVQHLRRSKEHKKRLVNLPKESIDSALIKSLLSGNWLTSPPEESLNELTSKASLFAFLPPDATSQQLAIRAERERKYNNEVRVGEESLKLSKRIHDIFIGGRQWTADAAYSALANLDALFGFIVDDYPSSDLGKSLDTLFEELQTDHGIRFLERQELHHHALHGLLCETSKIVAAFFAVANSIELQEAALANNPIPGSAFAVAQATADDITSKISRSCCISTTRPFCDEPLTWPIFRPHCPSLKKPAAPPTPTIDNPIVPQKPQQKKRKEPDNGSPPKADQPSPLSDEQKAQQHARGFLQFDGTGRIPNCQVKFTKGGEQVHLCMMDATLSRACRFVGNCKRLHLDSLDKLANDEERTKLTKYVTDNKEKKISWAPGHGPPTPAGTPP